MAGILYFELDANFVNCTTTREIIAKIDAIIMQLLTTGLTAATNGTHVSYKIDTGQTIQEVTYRSPSAISDTIKEYRRLRQSFVNDIIGNSWQNIGSKNLTKRRR